MRSLGTTPNKQMTKIMQVLIVAIIFSGCSHKDQSLLHERSRIDSVSSKYAKLYGSYPNRIDTSIIQGKLKLVYHAGSLIQAGNIANGQKKGEWYVFDDSLNLVGVLNCQNDSTSTVRTIRDVSW
jgi:ubiquitin C-terminal hydrolase